MSETELYTETTENLADYYWWLLPGFFKKKANHESWLYRLLGAFSGQLEEVREQIRLLNRQFAGETAEGQQLEEIGKARGTYRLKGETDTSYRKKVMDAYLEKQKAGTLVGIQTALKNLGFKVTITELFKTNKARWSEFAVKVTRWDGKAQQDIFYDELNRMKPAHTRPVIVTTLKPDVFDDGECFDQGQKLDSWTIT